MVTVYEVSGTIFQRNEFLAGCQDYERTWQLVGSGQYLINSDEHLKNLQEQIRVKNPEQNDRYGLVEIRDFKIERVTSFEWNEDGKPPLCGDDPETGEHWSWFGNHEPGCSQK
jgi:hypothetical protein